MFFIRSRCRRARGVLGHQRLQRADRAQEPGGQRLEADRRAAQAAARPDSEPLESVKGAMNFERRRSRPSSRRATRRLPPRRAARGRRAADRRRAPKGSSPPRSAGSSRVVEAYPDLKATGNIGQLQEELTTTENKIALRAPALQRHRHPVQHQAAAVPDQPRRRDGRRRPGGAVGDHGCGGARGAEGRSGDEASGVRERRGQPLRAAGSQPPALELAGHLASCCSSPGSASAATSSATSLTKDAHPDRPTTLLPARSA